MVPCSLSTHNSLIMKGCLTISNHNLSQVKLDLVTIANVIAMRSGNHRLRFIPLDYYDRLKYPSDEVYDTIMEYRMTIPELCRWIGHYMD